MHQGQDMEALLQNQNQLMSGLQTIWSNFKKDGPQRRTPDYIKRRLEAIDLYWEDFNRTHSLLMKFEDQSSEYFVQKDYDSTKIFYEEIRAKIASSATISAQNASTSKQQESKTPQGNKTKKQQQELDQQDVQSKNEGTLFTPSQFTNTKLEEMYRRQNTNFKALSYTLAKVNLENITERWEFEDILKAIETRWNVIDKLHWEIDNEIGDNIDYTYTECFQEHEENYIRSKKEINSKLWSVSHREKSTPTLDIPIFNGNYQQWVSFKDLFQEAIHNNPCLSYAQKMQFLKTKLKGEPERLIQHLQIGSDNYITCWDILNNRYNNKKLIFTTHMNTLLGLPVMQQPTTNTIKRIHDVTQECLNGIKNLGIDISTWDPILVHLLSQKLDHETHNDYLEAIKKPREIPDLKEFLLFLESKFTTLEASRHKPDNTLQRSSNNTPASNVNNRSFNRPGHQVKKYFSSNKATSNRILQRNKINCPLCEEEHGIYFCKNFLEMTPFMKRVTIDKLNLCANCLYSHDGKACNSPRRCKQCNGYHNSILHDAFKKQVTSRPLATSSKELEPRPSTSHVAQHRNSSEILLATAKVKIWGADGVHRIMRALIDQGSQVSLITEHAAQQLKLPRQKCKGVITGIGTKNNTCKGMITLNCMSLSGSYSFNSEVYIMKSLTSNLPSRSFPKPSWEILENLELADPEFYRSDKIDILFGADVYSNIILEGLYKEEPSIALQKTRLGWILCGEIRSLQCNVTLNNMEEITRFWEIEDINENISLTEEEQECITFYKSTTTRLDDGKYQVRLPLKSTSGNELGQSKSRAVAQFYQLERKFIHNKDIAYYLKYKEFIDEYLSLGHMKLAHDYTKPGYYMPHHSVLRDNSSTTSLRVVFNGSQPTSNGTCLNDIMHKGPNLQNDLLFLILKWRQHRIAFVADIEKMFRQIWMHEDDQSYQKVIWRDLPHQPLKEFELTTVTYGTKAAPFLAMMTLRKLAEDSREQFPDASKVVEECFYMDDLLHGSDSVATAKKLQQDLKTLMKSGGFNLRKWMSNSEDLLQDSTENQECNYNFKQPQSTKTLGLFWDPQQDNFLFQIQFDNTNLTDTKRQLLSEISKLFDPLGWLTPISTKLKLLFQSLWKTNLQWDDKLPDDIRKEWSKIKDEITIISQFKIPRWINTVGVSSIELHGYCDASRKAYACVIYTKVQREGNTIISLLVGKSKLVPHNKDISLPKLELNGALLLAKLMKKVKLSLTNHNIKIYGWTDSTAVLGWLQKPPENWKVFVANRVRIITDIIPPVSWNYVKSAENPADCASRGLYPTALIAHHLWWQGPEWLPVIKQEERAVPVPMCVTNEELKYNKQTNTICNSVTKPVDNIIIALLTRCNSFNKAVRVLSWVRRFITHKKIRQRPSYITLLELRQAKNFIIKEIQLIVFEEEIKNLQRKERVSTKSKITKLNPYLDQEGILRVGGRLQHAHIPPDMKNPIILPHSHRLTELLINHVHKLTCHGGARITLAYTRHKYWIIGGNNAVKKVLRHCVICKRHNPDNPHQIMGDLPEARVNRCRPFSRTGIDFTGQVYVKSSKGRGIKCTKGYVAVFVCMVTKAVHLELVSDLTTSALIAAIRRMAARRGTPLDIYSDNGRNFVGASNVLQEEYRKLQKILDDGFLEEIAGMEINWHFNAPAWPSAGGLWEAAVKSFKFHFKRVLGEQRLTYEELSTLLNQIEACLNSRPLCPLSEDPEDLDYLTPSHFLTGGATLTIVETEKDLRTRWCLTQNILNDIWKRWRNEYLAQLNARCKWTQPQKNINSGDVVLIQDDNLPPGKWAMGKVIKLHPGADGYVRVVTLKTKNGLIKRPIIKLARLLESQDTPNTSSPKNIESTKPRPQEVKKRSNHTKRSLWSLATLLTLFTLITSSECQVNIQPFKENQSIYFDKIGNMKLIRDKWNLIVYYNLDPYWQATKVLSTYLLSLKQTCDIINKQSHCGVILLQLNQAYSEIQYYNQLMLSQHLRSRATRRQRRGLINGIGSIAHSLFGVLDEEFAEQYRKDIDLIHENENHVALLWKNQTSIIEAEYNILMRTQDTMNQQHKLINQHMNELEKALVTLKNKVETTNYINDFNTGAIIANNMIQSLKTIQEILMDTITDIYQGRFNLHVLTPEQLSEVLSVISSKLQTDVSLPIDNIHTDLRKIYNLLKVKTRMLEDMLIFEIQIPLVSRDVYDIMQIYAIPKKVKEDMIYITPVADYISINIKRDIFILMTEYDIRTCLITSEDYFCSVTQPLFHIRSDKNFCEMKISECETTTKLCKNYWKQMNTVNTYLYFCCEPCQIRAICQDQVSAHQLTHAGLINIGQGCLIKTDQFTIFAQNLHVSEIKTHPEVYAPTMAPINHIINLTVPYTILKNISNESETEMMQMHERIKQLKEDNIISEKISYHDVHHYAMIYVIVGVVGIITLIVLIKRYKSAECRWRVARVSPTEPSSSCAARIELAEIATSTRATPALPPRRTLFHL